MFIPQPDDSPPFYHLKSSRTDARRQRKDLAARGRARASIDEAILRHRLGDPTLTTNAFAHNAIMQVLKPCSRGDGSQQCRPSSGGVGDNNKSMCASPCLDEDGNNISGGNIGGHSSSRSVQRRPISGETTLGLGRQNGTNSPFPIDHIVDNQVVDLVPTEAQRVVPTRPKTTPPRFAQQYRQQQNNNRRLHPSDPGKTVVVLASVPTVTVAGRDTLTRGPPSAMFASKSSHSMLSVRHQHRGGGRKAPPTIAVPKTRNQPWPMGRR